MILVDFCSVYSTINKESMPKLDVTGCFRICFIQQIIIVLSNRQFSGSALVVTTLYNVCAVPWGCSLPWGVQYRGGYHEYRGGYLEYRGRYHDKCGDILSTVGRYHEYRGGYLEYRGDVQYRGGYHNARGGCHEYRGGCSVPCRDTIL